MSGRPTNALFPYRGYQVQIFSGGNAEMTYLKALISRDGVWMVSMSQMIPSTPSPQVLEKFLASAFDRIDYEVERIDPSPVRSSRNGQWARGMTHSWRRCR